MNSSSSNSNSCSDDVLSNFDSGGALATNDDHLDDSDNLAIINEQEEMAEDATSATKNNTTKSNLNDMLNLNLNYYAATNLTNPTSGLSVGTSNLSPVNKTSTLSSFLRQNVNMNKIPSSNDLNDYSSSSPSKSSSNEFSSPQQSTFASVPTTTTKRNALFNSSGNVKSQPFYSYAKPSFMQKSGHSNCFIRDTRNDFDRRDDLHRHNTTSNSNTTSTNQSNKPVTKLFVGNLPTSTTLPELLAVFKKYGAVNEKLCIIKENNYAFIHYYSDKDAMEALKQVNDSLFKDRYIRVQLSTSQGYTHSKFAKEGGPSTSGTSRKKQDSTSSSSSTFSLISNNSNLDTLKALSKTRIQPDNNLPHSHSTSSLSSRKQTSDNLPPPGFYGNSFDQTSTSELFSNQNPTTSAGSNNFFRPISSSRSSFDNTIGGNSKTSSLNSNAALLNQLKNNQLLLENNYNSPTHQLNNLFMNNNSNSNIFTDYNNNTNQNIVLQQQLQQQQRETASQSIQCLYLQKIIQIQQQLQNQKEKQQLQQQLHQMNISNTNNQNSLNADVTNQFLLQHQQIHKLPRSFTFSNTISSMPSQAPVSNASNNPSTAVRLLGSLESQLKNSNVQNHQNKS